MRYFKVLLCCLCCLCITGCTTGNVEKSRKNLPFTVVSTECIPEKLLIEIEDVKKEPFEFTFSDGKYLYICIGYGEQKTNGYNIMVDEFYITDSEIVVNTKLTGPKNKDQLVELASYPFIVLKTEVREEPVVYK